MTRILGSLTTVETEALSDSGRILKLQTPYMRGPDVAEVQKKVGATIDGIYGPKTEARVKLIQENNGIEPTGVVGPSTWALLSKIGTPQDPARKNESMLPGKASAGGIFKNFGTALAEAKHEAWDPLPTSQKWLFGGGTAALLIGIGATVYANS